MIRRLSRSLGIRLLFGAWLVSLSPLAAEAGPIPLTRVVSLGTKATPSDLALLGDGRLVAVGSTGGLLRFPAQWTIAPDGSSSRMLLRDGGRLRLGTATRISANGDFIGGYFNVRNPDGSQRHDGAVWTRTQPGAPDHIPSLPEGGNWSSVYGVTNDRHVVGESGGNADPIQWSDLGGTTRLPGPGGARVPGAAMDVSADGRIVAGFQMTGDFEQATRWVDGVQEFLDPRQSHGFGVSPSGQYVVGMVNTNTFGLFSFSPAYWKGTELTLLSYDAAGNTFLGAAIWATDSGIVGGTTAPPGSAGAEGWLAFPGQTPELFNDWWLHTTGSPFPVAVTNVWAAVEDGAWLHFALSGEGAYVASIHLASAAVPEPAAWSLGLVGGALMGVGVWRRRRTAR